MTVTSRRRRARRRAVRTSLNMLSGFAAGGWSALVGLVVLPFYLKYLGIEAFGLVGFLLTLQAWFLLLDMGLSPTTSREMARFSGGQHSQQGIRNLFTSLEWVYALIAVFLALTLVAGARWLVSDWLQLKSLRPEVAAAALSLMAAMVAIQWMAMLYRSAINGLQRQVWLGGLTIALSSLRALASVAVLAWISPTLNAFVLAQSACYLMEAAVMRWYLGRRLPVARGRFSMAALKAVWQFAAGISAITVLATLLNQIDKLLLAKLLNLEEFGYFSLSMSVIGTLSIIVSPLFNAAYPRLTELAASGQNKVLSAEYHAFSQIAAFTILPIAATLAVFSSQAVYAWTGDRKLTGYVSPIISAWVVGAALNGLLHVPYALQLAVGWVRLSVVLNVLAVAIMFPALLLLVPRYGAVAAGWIWAFVNFFHFTVGIFLMHRRLLKGDLPRWYFSDLGVPCAATAVVVTVFWAAQSGTAPLGRFPSGALVASTLIAAALAAMLATPSGRKLVVAAVTAAKSRLAIALQ